MGTTLSSVDAVLKIFYDGPIRDQLNHEIAALELFEKGKASWSGKMALVPLKLGRNSTVFVAEEAATWGSTISQETVANLRIKRKQVYGRIELTRAVMKNMTADKDSFISHTALTVDGMVDSIKNAANAWMFDGGRILGFVWERKAPVAGSTVLWEFAGRLDRVSALVNMCGAGAQKPHVKFIRLDTYEYVTGNAVRVVGVDTATHSIQLTHIDANGVNVATDTTLATLATLPVGVPFALEVSLGAGLEVSSGTLAASSDGGYSGAGSLVALLNGEPTGVYTQLASQTHFVNESGTNADRRTGQTYAAMQSTIRTVASGSLDGNYVFTALNPVRLQSLKTKIGTTSGKDPDVIFCHPDARMAYTAAAIGAGGSHIHFNVGEGGAKKKLDLGVSNSAYTYEDLRWITSRHCGQSMFVFLNTSTWKMYENSAPAWADEDGNIMARVPNTDKYQGYYAWYFEMFCDQPNANGILVGFPFGDMVS